MLSEKERQFHLASDGCFTRQDIFHLPVKLLGCEFKCLFADHQTAELQPEHHLWSSSPILSNKLALNINLEPSFYLDYVSINQIESVNDWVLQNVNHPLSHPGEDKGGNSIADPEVNWRWGRREHTGYPGYLSLKREPQRKKKPHPRGGLQSSSKEWAGAQAKGRARAALRQQDEVSLQWDYQVSQGGGSSTGTLHSISLAEQSVTSLYEIRCDFQ